jgi:trimeric autotransporter adhesin
MRNPFRFPVLLSALLFAACQQDQPPTAPDSPGGTDLSVGPTATLVVNSLADPGDGTCNARECTLREAIKDSRSSAINFAPGLSGVITLARPTAGGGTLLIDKQLSIAGPGAGITIQRRSTDPGFRILNVGAHGVVNLTNLTLRNGKTDLGGAGLINFGSLTLVRCTIAGNSTTGRGGGIDNRGPLALNNSRVEQNSAGSGAGGIENHDKTVKLTSSSVIGNTGIGIYTQGGRLQLTGGEVSHNSAGGIAQNFGSTFLNRVRIMGNSSTGISNIRGSVSVVNSSVTLNSSAVGGGIYNALHGFFRVEGSIISNNSATQRGGGIRNTVGDPFGRSSADMLIINSTVSGNSAPTGGGIENSDFLGGAEITIINTTIARNVARDEGGGVRNVDSDPNADQINSIFLVNSLVALNTAPNAPDAAAVGGRFSLVGDGTGSGLTNTTGNKVGKVSPNSSAIDPKLGPLASNGGPTRTFALLAGSPAIDAGALADCPAKDQRGVARPRGAGCDMGSYER